MRHGCWIAVALVVALSCVALGGAGCGNVELRGDAMGCAEVSALDAAGFAFRVREDANASPLVRYYALENAWQWRWFVRSAKKDLTWGPRLPNDPNGI